MEKVVNAVRLDVEKIDALNPLQKWSYIPDNIKLRSDLFAVEDT